MSKGKYRQLKNRFHRLAKRNPDSRDEIDELRKDVFARFDSLKQEIERSQHSRKPSTPVGGRYILCEDNGTSNPKFTYRPATGELLFKFSSLMPSSKLKLANFLATQVVNSIPDDIKMVLRGTLHWSESNQGWRVTLRDNNQTTTNLHFTSYE